MGESALFEDDSEEEEEVVGAELNERAKADSSGSNLSERRQGPFRNACAKNSKEAAHKHKREKSFDIYEDQDICLLKPKSQLHSSDGGYEGDSSQGPPFQPEQSKEPAGVSSDSSAIQPRKKASPKKRILSSSPSSSSSLAYSSSPLEKISTSSFSNSPAIYLQSAHAFKALRVTLPSTRNAPAILLETASKENCDHSIIEALPAKENPYPKIVDPERSGVRRPVKIVPQICRDQHPNSAANLFSQVPCQAIGSTAAAAAAAADATADPSKFSQKSVFLPLSKASEFAAPSGRPASSSFSSTFVLSRRSARERVNALKLSRSKSISAMQRPNSSIGFDSLSPSPMADKLSEIELGESPARCYSENDAMFDIASSSCGDVKPADSFQDGEISPGIVPSYSKSTASSSSSSYSSSILFNTPGKSPGFRVHSRTASPSSPANDPRPCLSFSPAFSSQLKTDILQQYQFRRGFARTRSDSVSSDSSESSQSSECDDEISMLGRCESPALLEIESIHFPIKLPTVPTPHTIDCPSISPETVRPSLGGEFKKSKRLPCYKLIKIERSNSWPSY